MQIEQVRASQRQTAGNGIGISSKVFYIIITAEGRKRQNGKRCFLGEFMAVTQVVSLPLPLSLSLSLFRAVSPSAISLKVT